MEIVKLPSIESARGEEKVALLKLIFEDIHTTNLMYQLSKLKVPGRTKIRWIFSDLFNYSKYVLKTSFNGDDMGKYHKLREKDRTMIASNLLETMGIDYWVRIWQKEANLSTILIAIYTHTGISEFKITVEELLIDILKEYIQ